VTTQIAFTVALANGSAGETFTLPAVLTAGTPTGDLTVTVAVA